MQDKPNNSEFTTAFDLDTLYNEDDSLIFDTSKEHSTSKPVAQPDFEPNGNLYDASGNVIASYNIEPDGSYTISNLQQAYAITGPMVVYDENGDRAGTWLVGTNRFSPVDNTEGNDARFAPEDTFSFQSETLEIESIIDFGKDQLNILLDKTEHSQIQEASAKEELFSFSQNDLTAGFAEIPTDII